MQVVNAVSVRRTIRKTDPGEVRDILLLVVNRISRNPEGESVCVCEERLPPSDLADVIS